jgi:hypothetical protein
MNRPSSELFRIYLWGCVTLKLWPISLRHHKISGSIFSIQSYSSVKVAYSTYGILSQIFLTNMHRFNVINSLSCSHKNLDGEQYTLRDPTENPRGTALGALPHFRRSCPLSRSKCKSFSVGAHIWNMNSYLDISRWAEAMVVNVHTYLVVQGSYIKKKKNPSHNNWSTPAFIDKYSIKSEIPKFT